MMKMLACMLVALSSMLIPAHAHEAPSGVSYPLLCCSNRDCKRVTDAEIKTTPEGFLIVATGEVVPYGDQRVKQPLDQDMHICQQGGDFDQGRVLCLFDKPRGF